MLSVGILYRIQEFLELISSQCLSADLFRVSFPNFRLVSSEHVLNTSRRAEWIVEVNDILHVTEKGRKIIESVDAATKLRVQLADIMHIAPPPWVGLLAQGRKALLRYAGAGELQCFREAGLLHGTDKEVAEWWDTLIAPLRSSRDMRLTEIGRQGEVLSLDVEQHRTGIRPEWTALENPSAGYDLLSFVADGTPDRLLIEVKASELSVENAEFYLTRNEWEILYPAKHSLVHAWCLASSPPMLFEMSIKDLKDHIPTDCGSGVWQKVKIPYLALSH